MEGRGGPRNDIGSREEEEKMKGRGAMDGQDMMPASYLFHTVIYGLISVIG